MNFVFCLFSRLSRPDNHTREQTTNCFKIRGNHIMIREQQFEGEQFIPGHSNFPGLLP
ncbi:hypothetical protein Peur_004195 [Populus x canadensis]